MQCQRLGPVARYTEKDPEEVRATTRHHLRSSKVGQNSSLEAIRTGLLVVATIRHAALIEWFLMLKMMILVIQICRDRDAQREFQVGHYL
jgi:hypothetical protein